jgi:hypothetical protein
MGNKFGNAYGLTVLIPIKHGTEKNRTYDKIIRDQLQEWPLNKKSPLAAVPNTYLARLFLLNDVFYEAAPAKEEHLKSKYLVFSSNFFGDLDVYLDGMWNALDDLLKDFLRHCVAFEAVDSSADFIEYIKRCQINNSLFFNGSNDKPLPSSSRRSTSNRPLCISHLCHNIFATRVPRALPNSRPHSHVSSSLLKWKIWMDLVGLLEPTSRRMLKVA